MASVDGPEDYCYPGEEGFTIDLDAGTVHYGSASARMTFSDIENALGSVADDVISGDADANHLQGSCGNDRLDGRDGADHLDGGEDVDVCVNGETVKGCEL
jgi:Ca2+-binding RTX toxin-like protein